MQAMKDVKLTDKKVTVKTLEGLTPANIGDWLKDEHSLYGLVKAKGNGVCVMFRWRYRFGGKQCNYTCGTWPSMSLKEIRATRDAARQHVSQGKDPNQDRRAARLEQQATQAEAIAQAKARIDAAEAQNSRITVADLFDRWVSVDLVRRKDGGKEIQRMFAKDVLPIIGALAVEDVRKGHVTAVTDALLARGVTRMAKLIFALMRQMFRFAVDRDIIEADPTAAIRKAKIGGQDVERDRVLSEDEIRSLHRQLPVAALLPTTEAAIWLALATGCRIGELLQAEWGQIDIQKREWLIPCENSKNGLSHTIYLSDFAIKQFAVVQSITGMSRWCFPARDGAGPVCKKSATKQIGDRQRGAAQPMSRRSPYTDALMLPGGRWVPHDLRRTAATLMTALGVLPEIAERCLNHVEENRVKRTYQRHAYTDEKREAWCLLGARLEVLTNPNDNVVVLPARRA